MRSEFKRCIILIHARDLTFSNVMKTSDIYNFDFIWIAFSGSSYDLIFSSKYIPFARYCSSLFILVGRFLFFNRDEISFDNIPSYIFARSTPSRFLFLSPDFISRGFCFVSSLSYVLRLTGFLPPYLFSLPFHERILSRRHRALRFLSFAPVSHTYSLPPPLFPIFPLSLFFSSVFSISFCSLFHST